MIDLLTLGMFNMKLVTNSGQKAIIGDDDFVQINLLGVSGNHPNDQKNNKLSKTKLVGGLEHFCFSIYWE